MNRLLIALLGLITFVGSSWGQNLNELDRNDYRPLRRKGTFFTSPLLECVYNGKYVPPFEKELLTYILEAKKAGAASRISVYFQELNSGHSYGIDEDGYYSPASMMKAADMMHIYKLAEVDPEILNETIIMHKKRTDAIGDSRLREGGEYTVLNVMAEMILESDNQAMFALQDHFKNDQLWASVFRELGHEVDYRADNLKSITPKVYSTIFKALYNATYLSPEYSAEALKLLASTSFADGILRGVDDTTVVIANKFGFREWSKSFQFHETAIVYLNDNPYVLSVMTEGSKTATDLTTVIAEISRIIFNSYRGIDKSKSVGSGVNSTELVKPLFECYTDSIGFIPVKRRLMAELSPILQKPTIKDVSIYMISLQSGSFLQINPDKRYGPGSLMRLPHMMALLKASERNPILLEQRFKFMRDTTLFNLKVGDNGLIAGKEYSMKQLIERMVVFSDNDALDLIYTSTLNKGEVWQRLFNELGLGHLWKNNRVSSNITAWEYATFLRAVYNSSFLNNRNSELALEILSRSKFKLGIRKGIGQDDYAATKFGEIDYELNGESVIELHEGGIIYCEDNPYILCVMTRGTDFEDQAGIIEAVSKILYKEMSK
ncbi:MAG: hypothetical protein GC178_13640 [Flavobacteriales bacterium]|nr:hypothetical protein [Flavobacteriales bacterium]